MANMFALILVIATLVTGLLWCIDKFIFAPKRHEKQAAAQAATGDALDSKTLKKVAPKPGWLETGASVFPVLAIVLIVRLAQSKCGELHHPVFLCAQTGEYHLLWSGSAATGRNQN